MWNRIRSDEMVQVHKHHQPATFCTIITSIANHFRKLSHVPTSVRFGSMFLFYQRMTQDIINQLFYIKTSDKCRFHALLLNVILGDMLHHTNQKSKWGLTMNSSFIKDSLHDDIISKDSDWLTCVLP